MLIDGQLASAHRLAPYGSYTLTVEGRVTDNDIAPGMAGGFLAAVFQFVR
jgi:hypothetical protein